MSVDGVTASLGTKVDPGHARILLDGRLLASEAGRRTWVMLHKPAGVVTTRSDERGRRTVMDLLEPGMASLFPVGRLDRDTTGLLLLTDDGTAMHRLLHPSRHVAKTYEVETDRDLSQDSLSALRDGSLVLDDRPVAPAEVRRMGPGRFRMTLREGRKRQVRRMFEAMGVRVLGLHRSRFGPLSLGDLLPGESRRLGADEVEALQRLVED